MAILFEYTEVTNLVVLTGGTSGTPATFDDFVTFDRAGSAELLDPTSCDKAMSLVYQIRPVEEKALVISFIIGAKSADTDYLYITGTDAWGTALYEAIDISAGNGTYTSTRRFKTISNIDVEDVGDGSGTAAADGTLQVTQPQWGVIWDYGNGQYLIDAKLEWGNGSTTTHFQSSREMVYWADGLEPMNTAFSTLTIGALSNNEVDAGSYWSLDGSDINNLPGIDLFVQPCSGIDRFGMAPNTLYFIIIN